MPSAHRRSKLPERMETEEQIERSTRLNANNEIFAIRRSESPMREWIASLLRRNFGGASPPAPNRVIVLGQQIADAAAAERRRGERLGPSSAPFFDPGYDSWRGDDSLISPAPSPLDGTIRELCRSYMASDDAARARLRDSLHMNDFYTLVKFARRSAVFALREQRAELAQRGIIAISMIESERVDFRDILWCVALLHHAMVKLRLDVAKLFCQAAALAEAGTSGHLLRFLNQSDEYRDLRKSWGFDEVQTAQGVGFIAWGFQKFQPTVDLKSVAMEIAEVIARDKYRSGVEIATEMPPFWLSGKDDSTLSRVLTGVQGGATVSGSLRPGEFPQHEHQMLLVFIVQAADAADARLLYALAETAPSNDHAKLGLAANSLFCLIVARSFVQGVAAFETKESLARFSDPISRILRHYDGVPGR
jgi:hypothetical protein